LTFSQIAAYSNRSLLTLAGRTIPSSMIALAISAQRFSHVGSFSLVNSYVTLKSNAWSVPISIVRAIVPLTGRPAAHAYIIMMFASSSLVAPTIVGTASAQLGSPGFYSFHSTTHRLVTTQLRISHFPNLTSMVALIESPAMMARIDLQTSSL
jgi:hypothetical protein